MHAAATILLVIFGLGELAVAQPPPDQSWELAFDEDGIQVYRRFQPGSEIIETLTYATVDAAPAEVFTAITDYSAYPEFMPHMFESRVLSSEDDTQLIFQRLRLTRAFRFLLKDRYHVVRNRVTVPDEGGHHYRVEWSLDEAATRDIEVRGAVPTALNTGYWDLRDGAGTRTRVEYYLHTDPGGAIPQSFANKGATQSIPDVIRAIRDRVVSTQSTPD